MTILVVAGDVKSALTHFALFGLARVCENAGFENVTLQWTRESVPRAQLSVPEAQKEDIAEALLALTIQLSGGGQWPATVITYGAGKSAAQFSPFSPRIRAIDATKYPDDWTRHQSARHDALDALTAEGRLLDLGFLHALGETAYWRFDNNEPRPDHGASRWEMKTRNRGEEFIQHRFSKLVATLAGWSTQAVVDGLTGDSVNDALGKNKTDSRTSSGLTAPARTDVALAFAGLLGISAFPLAHQITRLSATPSSYPVRSLHPQLMVLPVPVEALTMARLQSVLLSQELAQVVMHRGESSTSNREKDGIGEALDLEAAYRWLRARGIPGVAQFPVLKTGSSSAPERQVLQGTVIPHGQ